MALPSSRIAAPGLVPNLPASAAAATAVAFPSQPPLPPQPISIYSSHNLPTHLLADSRLAQEQSIANPPAYNPSLPVQSQESGIPVQEPRLPGQNINRSSEDRESRNWEGSQITDVSDTNSSATLGVSDVASVSGSSDTAVNPIPEFPILLPVDHPLFDPFVHDTILWPRLDVLEEWEEERIQLEIEETLGAGNFHNGVAGPYRRQSIPRPAGQHILEQRVPAGRHFVTVQQSEAGIVPELRAAQDLRRAEHHQHPPSRVPQRQPVVRDQRNDRVGQQLFLSAQHCPIGQNQPSLRQPDSVSGGQQERVQEPRRLPSVEELFQRGFDIGLSQQQPPAPVPRASRPQLGSPIRFDNALAREAISSRDFNRSATTRRTIERLERTLPWIDPDSVDRVVEFELHMKVVEWEAMRNKALVYEQEITRLLELRDAGDGALERELDERTVGLRNAVEEMIFQDIEYCHNNEIPGKCWLMHHKIILRYSKAIAALKKDGKRPVELRKMFAYFTKFIKLSSKFYRALIQRLISHYGVHNLKFVAVEFKFEIDTSDQERDYPSQIQNFATLICYESLLHLGDLSRYRENYGEPNPRNPDSKNWGPAKGYYTLARKVLPAHPKAFNQLAVLAQYEQSHFTAIYYLYRSLLAEEPDEATHETTLGNLKICFVKILKDHASLDGATSDEITSMFSRYHAHCFLSLDASEYESLKSDLLNQITLAVKERAVPTVILNRMILINIAAEHLALSRDRATLSSPKVVTFLRFNIETFTSILMVLQQELDGTSQDSREDVADLVSAVTRRMLPSLRLYSAWLLISHHILVNETNDMSLNVQVKQLWQTYATTLSLLQSTFPMSTLSQSPYLLEEDDDIAGFKPLMDTSESRRLGKEIARVQERDHPNKESLARILYLLEDGIELCTAGNVPIDVKNNTFAFQDGIISTDSNTGNTVYPTITLRDIPVTGGLRATSTASRLGQANPMGSVISEPASTTLTNKMNAMVDDLVGSSHSREDSDDEEEVIVFKGRRSFYPPMASNPKASLSTPAINNATITAKSPMVAQAFFQPMGGSSSASLGGTIGPSSGKGKAPIPSNYMNPYTETITASASRSSKSPASLLTASDLVSYVQSYASRMTISQPSSSPATGQPGSSSMSVPQSGPADAVTPKLSSASLERSNQTRTPPLNPNPPYFDSGTSASSFNTMGSNYVQRVQHQPSNPEVHDANVYFRTGQRQHSIARDNARAPPPRQDQYNYYHH